MRRVSSITTLRNATADHAAWIHLLSFFLLSIQASFYFNQPLSVVLYHWPDQTSVRILSGSELIVLLCFALIFIPDIEIRRGPGEGPWEPRCNLSFTWRTDAHQFPLNNQDQPQKSFLCLLTQRPQWSWWSWTSSMEPLSWLIQKPFSLRKPGV